MARVRFGVSLAVCLAGGWFAAQAVPLPVGAPSPSPGMDATLVPPTPGQLPGGSDKPGSRIPSLVRADAFSSSADWIFDYGDLGLSDGVCENRDGRDSKVHFVTALPNDCQLTVQVLLLMAGGDHTQSFAIHFGAARPKDDLNDSGYGFIFQRDSRIRLVKGNSGNMDVIGESVGAALNAIPREVKIVRQGDQTQVFLDGVLRISASDGTYGAGGYLTLRTTQYPELSGGSSRWRFDNLSLTCYKP